MDTRRIPQSSDRIHTNYAEFAARLNAEFDRLSKVIESGSNRSRGFTAAEVDALHSVIEEKRAEFQAGQAGDLWIEYWQEPGRVHTVFRSDDRTKAIYQARLNRRPNGEPPMRYLGFRDDAKFRIFRFSSLPVLEDGTCDVRIPMAFFGRDGITFQEGPALCSTLLMEGAAFAVYDATREDVGRFLDKNRKAPSRNGSHSAAKM